MAFYTAEIKWFDRKAEHWMRIYERIPWLESGEDRQPPRTDRYLLTGEEGVGIKIRQGALEVKYRTGPPKLLEVSDRAIGRMEMWVKWSMKGGVEDAGDDRWQDIRKERRMKWFGLRGFRLHPVPPGAHPEEGCCIEFTKAIFGNGAIFYSLGYEAFSAAGAPDRNLIYALEQTLSSDTGLPEATLCRGYPALILEEMRRSGGVS